MPAAAPMIRMQVREARAPRASAASSPNRNASKSRRRLKRRPPKTASAARPGKAAHLHAARQLAHRVLNGPSRCLRQAESSPANAVSREMLAVDRNLCHTLFTVKEWNPISPPGTTPLYHLRINTATRALSPLAAATIRNTSDVSLWVSMKPPINGSPKPANR